MQKCFSDKGLVSRIHKEVSKLNSKKANGPIRKVGKRHKETFRQRNIQMAAKHVKICLISLANGDANEIHDEISLHTYENNFKKL